ncbi:MAG: glutamate-5-semialdehyde dehydrogenase [Bifidobacteriaceae bacterium]|jgi:glutamate-5-semialdehyde dehydrogenase|nr:glutamate-5-semialdehyde dehydrogenase [Bifidobacteriaceae bacterium]
MTEADRVGEPVAAGRLEVDATVSRAVREVALRARAAARRLATATRALKDQALLAMADGLLADGDLILAENRVDLAVGQDNGLAAALVDRLALTPERIVGIVEALRELAGLADPVGQVTRGATLPNGLKLRQVRVPMGVVGMIYEARPNVTADAAGLGLKSGNAVILRGGGAARRTNAAIVEVLRQAAAGAGLPADAIQTIDQHGREGVRALMRACGLVDLLIPRGGAGLIQAVVRESQVPVIETGVGNCHVYVDGAADLDKSLRIVMNSKTQRPSVCNAAETVLVDQAVAGAFLPGALAALSAAGVKLHLDGRAAEFAPAGADWQAATQEDWGTEYLALELAVGVVDGLDAAIGHIQRHSSGHTEAICTEDLGRAQTFAERVDSAVVMINASTRFTDGGQFGLGAEIGISTQKLHARGPMGLTELTSTKWICLGDGQVRV